MKRILSFVLAAAFAIGAMAGAMIATGCQPLPGNGGATTQPIVDVTAYVKWAAANLDQWTATAKALEPLVLGPNPSQASVDDYNRAIYWIKYFRAVLVAFGAPVPPTEPPAMVKLGANGRAARLPPG